MGLLRHFFDKVYCITSRKPNSRKANFIMQCKKLGFLEDISFYYYDDFDSAFFRNKFNITDWQMNQNDNVFSCALSHYNCIKDAKNKGYNKILIFEDDVYFVKSGKLIYEVLKNMPLYWDFIKFTTFDDICFNNFSDPSYYIMDTNKVSTGCYALSNKGIDAYLSSQDSEFRRADQVMTVFEDFGIKQMPIKKYFSSINICFPINDLEELSLYCSKKTVNIDLFQYNKYFKKKNLESSIWDIRNLNNT